MKLACKNGQYVSEGGAIVAWPRDCDPELPDRLASGFTELRKLDDGMLYEIVPERNTLFAPPSCPVCGGSGFLEDVPVGIRYPATESQPPEPWYTKVVCPMCFGFGLVVFPPSKQNRTLHSAWLEFLHTGKVGDESYERIEAMVASEIKEGEPAQ